MPLQKYFLLLLLLNLSGLTAQTIKGKITTIDNKIIETASIIIKDSIKAKGIKEYTIALNGNYEILLTKEYKTICVEIAVSNYSKDSFTISNPEKGKTYVYDFLLKKDKVIVIQEVKISAKRRSYTEVKDTVNFNVAAYKDGSDRKIQDVIKKLPGMEVNDNTGEIKYKGMSVETVQLDGEDLFSGNYTIGTKNINVNMIDQVQAIENFASNKLLKGLERDGKVALNLKLKKNIIDVSGSVNSSLGAFKQEKIATDSDANFLSVSSKIKSFGTLSYNNIALNYSPFDYFGNFQSKKDGQNQTFKNNKIIPEFSFLNMLDNKRTVLNNSIFANYNISLKKSPNTSYKSNLYFVRDAISSLNFSETNNTVDDQNFTTSDSNNAIKKPLLLRADFNIKSFGSESSSIDYDVMVSKEKVKSKTKIIQNKALSYNTNLLSDDFFLKSKIVYTKRISDNKAFQLTTHQTFDVLNQQYKITPQESNTAGVNAIQDIESRKTFFDLQSSIIGKIKRAKYSMNLGLEYTSNPLNSSLEDLTLSIPISTNAVVFEKNKVFLNNSFDYDWGNWRIFSTLNLSLLNRYLKKQSRVNDFIVEPEINLNYKFSRISSFNISLSSKINPQADNFVYANEVLINNRTTIKNTPSLALQKTATYNANYNLYDLSNQFQINIGVNYSDNKGDFFSNINIDQNNTQIEYFFLNEKFNNRSFNFMIEKYLPFMESTIRFKTLCSISNYKNFINYSEIRDNKSKNLINELFLKSAFDGKFNFENVFKYNLRLTINNENQNFENINYNNSFKLLFKPNKKWFANAVYDLYSTNQKTKYSFIDFLIKYTPSDKRFAFSLAGKNLLNNENFIEIQTSDYYTSIYGSNIMPRTLLISCNYSF